MSPMETMALCLRYEIRKSVPVESFKAIIPAWAYDKAVQGYGREEVSRLFTRVESWTDEI